MLTLMAIHDRSVAERMESLMAEIRALGRLPRRRRGLGDEYMLANRLHMAVWRNLLSESQLAELAEFELASADFERSEGAETVEQHRESLMAQIRALGHIPRSRPGLRAEFALAKGLREAKRLDILTPSQLAEVAELPSAAVWVAARRMETLMAEIRALGRVPRCTPGLGLEYRLAVRLQNAKKARHLSDSQLKEIQQLPGGVVARASVRVGGKRSSKAPRSSTCCRKPRTIWTSVSKG